MTMPANGWGNPVVGGTVLRIPAIQSPNFVHNTSGWAIFQDGTAEFNSITLPTGSGGATIFVQGTTPTAHHVNDMWVNTASGNAIETWNGSAWVAQQFGTGAIQANAITAALIAANTITAAQIASGTITATQIASHTITAALIAAGTITTTEIAANTITASNIAANTITAAQIAANTITAAQIAANTITASQIAANTITAGQIAANSITNATLAAWAVDGVVSQAGFHGLNMIPDPQFTNSTVNTARTSDAVTRGVWTLSSSSAKATNVNGSANILALLASANKPIWVNAGEQYYYSITVNRSGASTNQIGIQLVNQSNTAQTFATTAAGTTTISGVFTIPSGWTQMYARIFANSSAVADVITWSSPVLQPASLFSPTISGTDYIINPSGAFIYSGTPATGNLIASIASAAGTDAFTNAYKAYITAYGTSGTYAQLNAGTPANLRLGTGDASEATPGLFGTLIDGAGTTRALATQLQAPQLTSETAFAVIKMESSSADLTTSLPFVFIEASSPVATNNTSSILVDPTDIYLKLSQTGTSLVYMHLDGVNNQIVAGYPIIAATTAGGVTAETWHNMTLTNGWTNNASFGVAKYRLVASPPNSVEIIGAIAGNAATTNGFATLPAGYRPASAQGMAVGCTASADSLNLRCDTAGNLSIGNLTVPAAQTFFFHGIISLDA